MDLNEMARDAFRNSSAHGFWDDEPRASHDLLHYLGNKLMLIVGEVAEAHEDLRKGRELPFTTPVEVPGAVVVQGVSAIEEFRRTHPAKPEGLPSELADILIRVGDLAYRLDIDLNAAVETKAAYNATRPFKHGKKF